MKKHMRLLCDRLTKLFPHFSGSDGVVTSQRQLHFPVFVHLNLPTSKEKHMNFMNYLKLAIKRTKAIAALAITAMSATAIATPTVAETTVKGSFSSSTTITTASVPKGRYYTGCTTPGCEKPR